MVVVRAEEMASNAEGKRNAQNDDELNDTPEKPKKRERGKSSQSVSQSLSLTFFDSCAAETRRIVGNLERKRDTETKVAKEKRTHPL